MLRAIYVKLIIIIMGIGLCCCSDNRGGNKIYKYEGSSYLSNASLFNQFPGNQLNPLFSNKSSTNFYGGSTGSFSEDSSSVNFRYGYKIKIGGNYLGLAAGDAGLKVYRIKKDGTLEYSNQFNLVTGRSSEMSADISTSIGFGNIVTPCFFGDSLGSRYGYEQNSFSGVYGLSYGSLGDGSVGFFAACGISGVKFVSLEDNRIVNLIDQSSFLIREVCSAGNYLAVGYASYNRPNTNFSTFDQLDFLPEFGGAGAPYISQPSGAGKCQFYSKNENGGVDYVGEINCGSVNEISNYEQYIYVAHESGLDRVSIEGQGVTSEQLISGRSVFAVDVIKDYWAASVENGYYINGQFTSMSFEKNLCEDIPSGTGQVRAKINDKNIFANEYVDVNQTSFNLQSEPFSVGFSGTSNDLIIGALPTSIDMTSSFDIIGSWQGGLVINNENIFDIISNNCSNWRKSESTSLRNGYGNFQYTLSAIDIASKGDYTYVLDCPQYIANSMGPGWFTPLAPQEEKPREAPIELYLNSENGVHEAAAGILILKHQD